MQSSGTLPSVVVNGQKSAVFKDPTSQPYGGFANTTKADVYPVKQTVTIDGKSTTFNWPSSEHAYHAQKLLNLKSKLPANDPAQKILTDGLNKIQNTVNAQGEFHPSTDFKNIVNDMISKNGSASLGKSYDEFSKNCDFSKYDSFMADVLKMKFAQHPDLKAIAMQMARDGIMPIEYSNLDKNWASGPNGDGNNKLGIMILEEGNRLLREAGETPKIADPKAAYAQMKAQGTAALSHDALQKHSGAMRQVGKQQANAAQPIYQGGRINNAPVSSNLDVKFDAQRNHTTVSDPSRPDLQLQYKQDGTFKRAIFRDKDGKWQESGDLNRPWIQNLMKQYDAHLTRAAQPALQGRNNNAPATSNLDVKYDAQRNHTTVSDPSRPDLQLQYKQDGTFKRAIFRDKDGKWQESGDLNRPWIQNLMKQYGSHLANAANLQVQPVISNPGLPQNPPNTQPTAGLPKLPPMPALSGNAAMHQLLAKAAPAAGQLPPRKTGADIDRELYGTPQQPKANDPKNMPVDGERVRLKLADVKTILESTSQSSVKADTKPRGPRQ